MRAYESLSRKCWFQVYLVVVNCIKISLVVKISVLNIHDTFTIYTSSRFGQRNKNSNSADYNMNTRRFSKV